MERSRLSVVILGAAGAAAVAVILFGILRSMPATPPGPDDARSTAGALGDTPGACAKAPNPCACLAARARHARDNGLFRQVLKVLTEADAGCSATLPIQALQAEALAAEDQSADAEKLAAEVLAKDAKQRDARRARAYAAISRRDFEAADKLLGELLAEQPDDLSSTFAVALSNARRNRYNQARQGFISVTRRNRKHVEARYQLVLLTTNERIVGEAKHHLSELRAIAPIGDERLVRAEQAVKTLAGAPPPGSASPMTIKARR